MQPSCLECPGYDIKKSVNEIQIILELWGIQSTHSLPLLPSPLWPEEKHLIGSYLWVK